MRLYLTVILFLTLLSVAIVFGSQNHQIITLNYIIARIDISVAAAVSVFTVVGFILGLLFCFLWKLLNIVSPKNKS